MSSPATSHRSIITKSSPGSHKLPQLSNNYKHGRQRGPLSISLSPASSISSLTSSSLQSTDDIQAAVKHQKILKTVGEWFQTWRSWQQKILLCGITNRCSMSQLEALATTLEPVFHRDFITSLSSLYPTKSIKLPKLDGKRKGPQKPERKLLRDLPDVLENVDKEHLEEILNSSINIQGNNGRERQTATEETQQIKDIIPFAEAIVTKAFQEALQLLGDDNAIQVPFDDDLLQSSLSQIDTFSGDESSVISPECNSRMELLPSLPKASFTETLEWLLLGRDVDRCKASQHHNSWSSHRAAPAPSLPPIHCNRHPDWSSARSRRIGSSVVKSADARLETNLHRHRKGTPSTMMRLRSVDFFSSRSVKGPMQTELRTGSVYKPAAIADINVPIQKLYKNSKWFRRQPAEGKTFMKPHRLSLARHYLQQLNQVWQWLSLWKDYESLALLSDIVKLCDQDMITYLAQCLYYRLQERVDVNWLPDQVLLVVFANLTLEDIMTCQQVCKRWKYLCSIEQLWQFKCQEFGYEQGIADMQGLILRANTGEKAIDWQLAYLELHTLTSQAMTTVRGPPEFHIKETPPLSQGALLARESARLKRGLDPEILKLKKRRSRAKSMQEGVDVTDDKPDNERLVKSVSIENDIVSRAVFTSQESSVSESLSRETTLNKSLKLSRHRKRHDDDEEEKALDVRMMLTQPQDLLSPIKPKYELMWKPQAAASLGKKAQYAGLVQPVQRVRKLLGHMDGVLCVEMDKRRLISGSMDRSIRIWDIRSGTSIHKLYGHKGAVSCLKFTNEVLYSGSWDMTVMVWDLVTFERKAKLTGHMNSVSCLSLSDKFIMSGSHDGSVRLWCVNQLKCIRVIKSHSSHILCIQCDEQYLYTGSSDRTITVCEIQCGNLVKTLTGSTLPVHQIVVSSHLIIGCDTNGRVYFWDLTTGQQQAVIEAHSSAINALAFHRGHFYTASSDQTIKEWDLVTMTCLRSLVGHKTQINDLKVNDRYIVSCSSDGHIRLWDLRMPSSGAVDTTDDVLIHDIIHQRDLDSQ